MDEQNIFTPFDEMVQTKELQMLKTLIPYLPSPKQKQIIYLINFLQFRKAIDVIENPPAALCAAEVNSGNDTFTAILNALRKYCSNKEQETIDTIINLLCIVDNYDTLLT